MKATKNSYPVYPDIKRMYLVDRASHEADDSTYTLLLGVLHNYDRGLLDIAIDPWNACVKYRTLELQ